jgi:hypothetical protein
MTAKKAIRVLESYEQAYDGEWYQLALRAYNFDQCCDCGLVHKTRYRVVDKAGKDIPGSRILTVTWRAPRSTAAVRRNFKFEKDDD